MCANPQSGLPVPREGYVPVGGADLYYREIGHGQPIIILHGGPSLNYNYLLPDMDRLSDSYRLIYYDQRGRGKSARNVQPEDITMVSEVEDLERVRIHLQLQSIALLGHSWGALLALEYTIRHPDRVSSLILMATPPASHDDYLLFQQEPRKRAPGDAERLAALAADHGYQKGNPDTVAEYFRTHFRATLKQPELLDRLIENLMLGLTRKSIIKGRAISARLSNETWLSSDYDLLPKLRRLSIPTLVIHGDYDSLPVKYAAHVAEAIPGARLALLGVCGHFAYLECPEVVHREINDFLPHRLRR